MKTYRTAQVAKIAGVHPNTVRLYESLGLIPKAERKANGYRVFTDLHIEVFKLARLAFQVEILQNGLRKKIVNMVKTAASGDFNTALTMTDEYLRQVRGEQKNARDAINIVKQIWSGGFTNTMQQLKRNETAKLLQISMDTLRNWEMNGLLTVKRRENGYRVYTSEDIDRLKMIRSLRCANYSLEAILHLLSVLSHDPEADIEHTLDNLHSDDDIISVYDKLLTSLKAAEENAVIMREMLLQMKTKF